MNISLTSCNRDGFELQILILNDPLQDVSEELLGFGEVKYG